MKKQDATNSSIHLAFKFLLSSVLFLMMGNLFGQTHWHHAIW